MDITVRDIVRSWSESEMKLYIETLKACPPTKQFDMAQDIIQFDCMLSTKVFKDIDFGSVKR